MGLVSGTTSTARHVDLEAAEQQLTNYRHPAEGIPELRERVKVSLSAGAR